MTPQELFDWAKNNLRLRVVEGKCRECGDGDWYSETTTRLEARHPETGEWVALGDALEQRTDY